MKERYTGTFFTDQILKPVAFDDVKVLTINPIEALGKVMDKAVNVNAKIENLQGRDCIAGLKKSINIACGVVQEELVQLQADDDKKELLQTDDDNVVETSYSNS